MKEVDSYVFDRMDAEKLKREAAAVMQLGFPAEYVEQVDRRLKLRGSPFSESGAVSSVKICGSHCKKSEHL